MQRERVRVFCDASFCHANAWAPARGWTEEADGRDFCRRHSAERAARFICPPEHPHDEDGRCYTHHGCRCDDCREWQAAYQRRLRRTHAQQRFGVKPPLPRARVDARGVRRRVQALVARGWSLSKIGGMVGLSPTNSPSLVQQDRVTAARRDEVFALYERLWNVEPPSSTWTERRSARMAKQFAAARRWVPPLAWDDIDEDVEPPVVEQDEDFIDEAVVVLAMEGERPRMTSAERREVVRRLHRERWGDRRIAAAAGMASETVLRIRQELGLPGIDRDEQAA